MKSLVKIIVVAAIILVVASNQTISNYIVNEFNYIVSMIKDYF